MDTYRTISKPSEPIMFKERKSKFYCYCFPVSDEDTIKEHIEALRKEYPTANHVCYAWQMGVETKSYRANDDGEPNNSAGMPIYGQLQSFDVTNTLVAVVRVFGGTKLGIGGLISAYKEAAKLALENAAIITKVLQQQLSVTFEYSEMDIVMRLVKKHQLNIVSQDLHLKCKMILSINKSDFMKTLKLLKAHHKLDIKEIV
ncbi:IMPACT family protein [Maribacter hydrothermalis]|uniref:YigZ family protein n=1 Tax=Maribacter hydrothermalis TaxID=1836467 RepID=A0A1B7Z7Y4_9FLAO|nr:YigZ family protein [Maribacter hydrothermalis]APQ19184.1 YigZ family protein [Maribacter hydrothermalis]OBR38805.1 YigZ family protein [Maribacter hydrothermalis]